MGHSRFYLCDLQVHTPADNQQRYGDAGGRDPNETFAKRLIEAHASAGVEVMAVSDHNRIDWYPVLRAVGDATGVVVFPAVEVSVNRCHLLAIWDRTEVGYQLALRFLDQLWGPGESSFNANGDPRPVSRGQVLDVVHEAVQHKGLVLAPHSTMRDIGFFARGVCTNRKQVIESGDIAGFDVWGDRSADVLRNPASEFGEATPPWFMSGDVRSFDDVGTRAVYLKLGEEPSLEGLRQAFLMPETRIRFPVQLQEQWGHLAKTRFISSVTPSWPRIIQLSVEGGFHDKLELSFGPGLNAIIGGKGTGKSTLIEIIRYVMHAGEPNEIETRGNRERNFKANAEAVVSYVDDDAIGYEIHRSGSADPARLLRGGSQLAVDVDKRVPIRVFGQRELQALADQPEALRAFVAVEAGPNWNETIESERGILASIRSANSELHSIEAELEGLNDDEHALVDITDKIDQAIARGAGEHIERLAALTSADASVRSATGWPRSVGAAVDGLTKVLPPPEIDNMPTGRVAMVEALEKLGNAVAAATISLAKEVREADNALMSQSTEWTSQHERERKEIERQLADAGLRDPRELGELQTRAQGLRERLSGVPKLRARHGSLQQQRGDSLKRLADVRRSKSRLVEQAADRLNTAVGPRVRVRVEPLAYTARLVSILERAVKGQGVRSEQLRKLASAATSAGLAALIEKGPGAVELMGASASTASKLCALPRSVVREIEEAETPDQIAVEVNLADPSGEEAWSDVTEVSPGQRATALLALALVCGREPLIIDQPEDDLDNRYIYDEVVRVIAEVCQARQVIVATHNANIPVLGDAEMVVALDAQSTSGRILAAGGLETPAVAACSRKILEGGETAFRARHRRYLAAT